MGRINLWWGGPGKTIAQIDYSSFEIRLARYFHYDLVKDHDLKNLGFQPGDYIRTKRAPREIRICTQGTSWIVTDPDHSRLKIRARKPGSRKSHWTWADRWVKASPLEALASQAGDQHEIR